MYEELVKALRCCPDDNIPCKSCPRCVQCTKDRNMNSLFTEAADAIEELNLIAESLWRNAMAWADTAEKAVEQIPRWIPVTERLPEEYIDVLCYCSRNGQYGCGEWIKEDNGTIYWSGLNGMIPTHWMPLPSAPEPLKEAEE